MLALRLANGPNILVSSGRFSTNFTGKIKKISTLVFSDRDFTIGKFRASDFKLGEAPPFYFSCVPPDKKSDLTLIAESSYFHGRAVKSIEPGWNMFFIKGTISFESNGVLAPIIERIAKAKVSILVFSSFDTDYIFFKKENRYKVMQALQDAYQFKDVR